jgi:hypothetical protein
LTCILFDTDQLIPDEWRPTAGPVRAFNPAILRDGDGWLLAVRLVLPDLARRISLCRLDRTFRVVGPARALSDQIRVPAAHSERARSWFADPRLYRLAGRLFIYWNSGWHEPANHQFMQELDPEGLVPVGAPRELVFAGRRPLEKNWSFFESDILRAVYAPQPHSLMNVSFAETTIELTPLRESSWVAERFSQSYGELRGGAPPVLHDGHWYSLCHAYRPWPEGYEIAAAVYRFSAQPPYAPTDGPSRPLDLPNPFGKRTTWEPLNPAVRGVVYPCGAAYEQGNWIVSYGINDEHAAVAIIPHETLLASMEPVKF